MIIPIIFILLMPINIWSVVLLISYSYDWIHIILYNFNVNKQLNVFISAHFNVTGDPERQSSVCNHTEYYVDKT